MLSCFVVYMLIMCLHTALGLPFHSHGKTWLAVVHGSKRWFVYPPGCSPDMMHDSSTSSAASSTTGYIYNPLQSVQHWLRRVYAPMLQNLPHFPPSFTSTSSAAATTTTIAQCSARTVSGKVVRYKPLECLQRAGQVVYLPDGWSHLTINVGETIAFGGQSSFSAVDR